MLETNEELPPKIGGGPLGLGDPDDRRLRKTEKHVIIAKMQKEEAQRRCSDTMEVFYSCAKEAGLRVTWMCQEENRKNKDCVREWLTNPEFLEEITNKYLDARSHYRRTGEPVIKYQREKNSGGSGFC